eukprot:m.90681 g.90681  ORF g.90681 m.90681 type:complete len:537 (-) comp21597_c1_seq4:48-1658(-)
MTPADELFFGHVPTFFEPTGGEVNVFDPSQCKDVASDADSPERRAAIQRMRPLASLGFEYENVVVVAVPRTDVCVSSSSQPSSSQPPNALLSKPLVKTRNGSLRGVASGVRSGLIYDQQTNRWYRLKGCGNNEEGFVVQPVLDEEGQPVLDKEGQQEKPLRQIRGCCFPHTSLNELQMSHRVDELLKPFGMRCANRPIALYKYEIPNSELPKIIRTCSVFETEGDRRLSDHVLRGIELLLPALIDKQKFNAQELWKSFPDGVFGRRGQTDPDDQTVVFSEIDATSMQYACNDKRDSSTLLDLASKKFSFLKAPHPEKNFPANAPKRLKTEWKKNCDILAKFLEDNSDTNLLAYIYWRFGWECAVVIHVLEKAEISWGTYRDLIGTHCNAHGNNFVLMPENPNNPSQPFLAPLDFDMAYNDEVAILGPNLTPEKNRQEAKENRLFEANALAMDLALSKDTSGTKNDHKVPKNLQVLQWALRDTMVRAYMEHAKDLNSCSDESPQQQPQEPHPLDKVLTPAAYALLKLALIQTWDVKA